MVNFIIDIVLVAVAVIIIVRGWKNGAVKGILSFAVNIVAAVVAYAFTPKLAALIYDNWILQKISSGIEKTVGSLARSGDGYDFAKLIEEMPEVFSNMLTKYGVKSASLEEFASGLSETGEAALRKVSDFIASPVSTIISNALAFIVIFIVALIVLKLASKLIITLFKAPLLKTADRLAGLLLGCLNAVIILWIVSIVVSHGITALGSVAPSWFGEDVVERSVVLGFFAKYNPLKIIENVISFIE